MTWSRVPRGSVGRATRSTIRCGALQLAAASGEAATQVGAPLSAKDKRTYWDVCPEGQTIWEYWKAEFEAKVKRNEEEAADFWRSLSQRQMDVQRCWLLGDHRNMKRGDGESNVYEQLRRDHSQELGTEIKPIPPSIDKSLY